MTLTLPAGLSIQSGPYNSAAYTAALHLRVEVFIEEQGFSMEDELDDKDEESDHLVLMREGEAVGTIRWFPPKSKLGRLCVRKSARGIGAGKWLVLALEEHVVSRRGKAGQYALEKELHTVKVECHSQEYAIGFYSKLGYAQTGEIFIEDGSPHAALYKTLDLQPLE